jgi:uncharacterized protein with HEPN domain
MQRDAKKYLHDIVEASDKLQRFTKDKSYQDYLLDELLQAAVERQFEIIGEATNKLSQLDIGLADQLPDYRKMISFRNILIHAYDRIDPQLVWGVVESNLIPLLKITRKLLAD